ncbi:MAG TPA: DUF362 domain-containing protein [Phycisphaerae bacterium]|nr:DUF362 domain-containing protein [Phycisphaerae bacterium]
MATDTSRREFLEQLTAAAAAAAIGGLVTPGCAKEPDSPKAQTNQSPRVAIARDDALARGAIAEHAELLRKMLDAAVQKVTGDADAASAWRKLFKPDDRVGIKVNALGLPTQPVVVEAIVAGLILAGVAPRNVIIWDRFDTELTAAGFKLNKSADGVQCRGTDAERIGGGYQKDIESNGRIGSCFSRIVAEEVNALICVPVLKDHNLAGASLGMKNFYGAIHNPNKYHSNNCDPFVADVVSHRFIGPKWRLTVCDGTRAQYNAGPARNPTFAWPFNGLIVGADFVAVDAVGADLVDTQRKAKGLKTLAEENRPAKHIMTAAARGLGVADLTKIERIEV